jgi:gas vesicle protein
MLSPEFMMNAPAAEHDGHGGFLLGLVTGGAIGVALTIAFAPRLAAELRQRVVASAGTFGGAASRRYRDASARMAGVVDQVTVRGQAARDDVADAVARGAREVEQFARASKSGARRS